VIANRDQPLTFNWTAVARANSYAFTLFHADDRKTAILRTDALTRPSYSLLNSDNLTPGEYVWQVQAFRVSNDGIIEQSGAVAEYSFTLSGPILDAPKPEKPEALYGN
jgi:hypothetical protein